MEKTARAGRGAGDALSGIFSAENIGMARRAVPKILALILAPGAIFLLVVGTLVGVAGIGSPMTAMAGDGGVEVSCRQCPPGVSRIARLEVGEGENAIVDSHLEQGEVKVTFRQGAGEQEVDVSTGMRPETVLLGGGEWTIQAVSTGDWNVGNIDISPVKAESAPPNKDDKGEAQPVDAQAAPNTEAATIEISDLQWTMDTHNTWDGRKVPYLRLSATARNASDRRLRGSDMPALRVGEREYALTVESHPIAGGLDAGETSVVKLETPLDLGDIENPQFAFAAKDGTTRLSGVDGLADAITAAYSEKASSLLAEQQSAAEEKAEQARQQEEARQQEKARIEAENAERARQQEEAKQQEEARRQEEERQRLERAQAASSAQPRPAGEAQGDNAEDIVYRTENGDKYHQDGCQHLKQSKIPMTRGEAIQMGLEPCAHCHP